MIRFAPLVLLLLSGCATAEAVYGPTGNQAHTVSCLNPLAPELSALSECYKKAGEICGTRGYEVLDGERNKGWSANRYGGNSVTSHTLLIQCKRA